jgi:hypothetical protein
MACTACDDTGWVGEEHPGRPQRFGGRKRCRSCDAAGMPCHNCNEPVPGECPPMPAGFAPDDDSDKGSIH